MTLLTKAHDSLPLMNSADNPANAVKTAWHQLVVTITRPNLIAIVAYARLALLTTIKFFVSPVLGALIERHNQFRLLSCSPPENPLSPDMERAMTMSLDATTVHPRRAFRWAAMIAGSATAVILGLVIAQSFFYIPTNSKAGANTSQSQPVAAAEPVTLEIVPSPVIETNPKFFFGSGDGSNGYYAERPNYPE